MNKQEYTKWQAYYNAVISKASEELRKKRKEYIEANVKHQIGAIVTVLDCKHERVLRVKDYDITDGKLIPCFVTLEGKEHFVSTRATIVE